MSANQLRNRLTRQRLIPENHAKRPERKLPVKIGRGKSHELAKRMQTIDEKKSLVRDGTPNAMQIEFCEDIERKTPIRLATNRGRCFDALPRGTVTTIRLSASQSDCKNYSHKKKFRLFDPFDLHFPCIAARGV
jgi:hypothetical protein